MQSFLLQEDCRISINQGPEIHTIQCPKSKAKQSKAKILFNNSTFSSLNIKSEKNEKYSFNQDCKILTKTYVKYSWA